MKSLWSCRRTFLATLAILCLTAIAMVKGTDTSMAIALASGAVAAANAAQAVMQKVSGPPVEGERNG
jgi:hypothetical protein